MGEKRIPCPFCKEQILPIAVKCRYCGENLVNKKTFPSLGIFFLIWFCSLATFYVLGWLLIKEIISTEKPFWLVVFGLIILLGLAAFMPLIVNIISSIKERRGQLYGLATLLTLSVFLFLLFYDDPNKAKADLTPNQANNISQEITPTATPTVQNNTVQRQVAPVNTANQIDCTGPDGVVFKTTQEECDSFNAAWGNTPITTSATSPNDIIRCNIHPDCGGGFKEMTRSSCEEMTCCTTDTGSAVFTSKSQCSKQADDYCMNQVNQTYSNDMANCTKNLSLYSATGYDCTGEANKLYEKMKAICGK